MDVELILVLVIVAMAVLFIGRKVQKSLRSNACGGCGGCTDKEPCSAGQGNGLESGSVQPPVHGFEPDVADGLACGRACAKSCCQSQSQTKN